MANAMQVIPAGELSGKEEEVLETLANHITQLEKEANLTGLGLRLNQAADLIAAFETLTGRTPFDATADSARQRFSGWVTEKHRDNRVPFDDRKAWELIHLHRFCEKRPAALEADNMSVSALIELARPKLITGKAGAPVNPAREKIVSETFRKLLKRKNVTVQDAKKTVYADLEAANLCVYKAPPKKMTLAKYEEKIINMVADIEAGFSDDQKRELYNFIIREIASWK